MAYVMLAEKYERLAFSDKDTASENAKFQMKRRAYLFWSHARASAGFDGGYIVQLTGQHTNKEVYAWLMENARGRYYQIQGLNYLVELLPDATLLALRFE